jgi:NAD(P)-dependent dehydrogenase (short-subunit alcohol dehydrogenase family)
MKKIAVVTGACRGIGLAIAQTLEREGFAVVYSDKFPLAEIKDSVTCDISDPADRENLLKETLARHGRVDLLVNNAGVAPKQRLDLLETTAESYEFVMDINLKGTFFMCQLFANQMIKQDNAEPCKIINIASISSYTSSVNRGEYCISKAGVSMVTQLFADRLSEYGVGVYEIRPGIILTDMTKVVQEKYQHLIDNGLTPIKRFGQPQDVADAAAAIAKGYFDFATGQVFNADGGFHMRRL